MRSLDPSEQSSTTSVFSSSSLASSKSEELAFLRRNPIKRMLNGLFSLYAYVYSVLPIQHLLYRITLFIRCMQILIPSFFFNCKILYPKSSKNYPVAVFLSFFYRFIPIDSPKIALEVVGWIYVAILLIYLLFTLIITFIFSKKSTIPMFVSNILSYTMELIDLCPHTIAISIACSLINHEDRNVSDIVLIVFIFLCFLSLCFVMFFTNLGSIYFFPSSIPLIYQWTNSAFVILSACSTFFSEFGSTTSNATVRNVFFILTPIFHLINCFTLCYVGIIVVKKRSFIIQSTFYTSIIMSIISIVYSFLETPFPDYLFCIFPLLFIIFYVTAYLVDNAFSHKSLALLDLLEENADNLANFKVHFTLYHHILNGFCYFQRYVLSYNIFRDLLSLYPENLQILQLYLKFLIIYPEDFSQASWVYNYLRKMKKQSILALYIQLQLQTILMRRESILSVSLKKKLSQISTLSSTAKLRIRNTWETILSGNLSDLEPLFAAVYKSIFQLETKFMYVLNYHSNNQYAIMAYANYQREIKADFEQSDLLKEKVRAIQCGHNDSIDQVYLFARLLFSNLPLHPVYRNMKDGRFQSVQQIPFDEQGIMNDVQNLQFDKETDDEAQSRLRTSIERMHIPALKCTIILNVFFYILFFIVPFIIAVACITLTEQRITGPANIVSCVSQLQLYVASLTAMTARLLGENMAGIATSCSPDYAQNEVFSSYVGGSCDSADQLAYFAEMSMAQMQELGNAKLTSYDTDEFTDALSILFDDKTDFMVFTTSSSFISQKRSLQQILVEVIENSLILSASTDPAMLTSRYVSSFMVNFRVYITTLDTVSQLLLEFLFKMTDQITVIFTALLCIGSILFSIIFIIVTIVTSKWILSQKRKIYGCFYALPKTVLSKMIDQLSASSMQQNTGRNDGSVTQTVDVEAQRIEEKTISVFRAGEMGSSARKSIQSYLFCFVFIGLMIGLYCFLCTFYMDGSSNFDYSTPQLSVLANAYTKVINANMIINVAQIYDTGYSLSFLTRDMLFTDMDPSIEAAQAGLMVYLFGNYTANIDPISSFIGDPERGKIYSDMTCDWNSLSTEHDIDACTDELTLFIRIIDKISKLSAIKGLKEKYIPPDDEDALLAWHLIIAHLYPNFIIPHFIDVDSTIKSIFQSSESRFYFGSIVCLVLGALLTFIHCLSLSKIVVEMKTIMFFILHAPPQVLLKSDYIMSIFAGDFSSSDRSGQSVDENSYKEVADRFPDGIAKLGSNKIEWENKAAQTILGKSMQMPDDVKYNLSKSNYETQFPLSVNDDTIVCMLVKSNGHNFLILRDNSHTKELEKEIEIENTRLRNIIIKMLPNRMAEALSQEHSKSCFSVQTATIAVFDFPSIPKGSLIAIFKKLEELLPKYPTIPQIDIVGNNLVATAGIFETVNQSEKHASDAISFAVEGFKVINEIKTELNTTFDVKIGVATGGPVYIGILTSNRPYFEVCGETIDFAYEMAATAPTDAVHTTRSVYELIYGKNLTIKERGEVSLGKYGSAVTYLVTL